MILILLPLAILITCIVLYNKMQNPDNQECVGCVLAIAVVSLMIFGVVCFLMHVCDYDKYEVEMDRANIVRYIEVHGDDAKTNDDVYNTIYNQVYNFNHTVYKRQRCRSSLLTNWFRAGWWMEIEPIDWTP